MPKIKTSTGWFKFKTLPLYGGVKLIDKEIAKENLLLLKPLLDASGAKWGLIFGTLLGAIREKDFITHDEDIDLSFFMEDKQKIIDHLPVLFKNGFKVARYDRKYLISIMRKGEYIDFYFYKPYKNNFRTCAGCLIPEVFLKDTISYSFLGDKFIIPRDYIVYLEYEYGKSWKTPIKFFNYKINPVKRKILEIREYVKDLLPDFLYFYLKNKVEKKIELKYLERFNNYTGTNS